MNQEIIEIIPNGLKFTQRLKCVIEEKDQSSFAAVLSKYSMLLRARLISLNHVYILLFVRLGNPYLVIWKIHNKRSLLKQDSAHKKIKEY